MANGYCDFNMAIILGVDSPFFLNHRSFQNPVVFPGFPEVFEKEGFLERMETEGAPRIMIFHRDPLPKWLVDMNPHLTEVPNSITCASPEVLTGAHQRGLARSCSHHGTAC